MTSMLLHGLVLLALTPTVTPAEQTLRLAVRTSDTAIVEALREAPMQRFVLPQRPDLKLEISPEAEGEVVVEVAQLPAAPAHAKALAERLSGVPAALHEDGFELGGARYRDPGLSFAVRLPQTRHWIVGGYEAKTTANVVDLVLRQEAAISFSRRQEPFDYLVFEHDHSRRSGRWQQIGTDVTANASERDDMRRREMTYASMWQLERAHIKLRVPAAARQDPRAMALAATLDAMVPDLLARLGKKLEQPIEIVVEADHVEQGRHTGDIDPAVLFRDRLHLVYHSDDVDFYRVEMARLLIRRARLKLPPLLEDGAALWLAERWYGRHFDDWMPDLTAADVLPNAEEIRARKRSGDGSKVIFSPAIAWGFDQLPARTLIAKLEATGHRSLAAKLSSLKPPTPKAKVLPARATSLPFQHGVSFAMSNGLEIGYHAPGVDDQLAKLKAMGSDAVSLMPFAYQARSDSSRLSFLNRSPSSETDVGVIHAARRAHEQDFYVLWKPHIWLSHDSWPGDIAMAGEADWQSWWRSYRRYIVHHAMLAQFADADMFSVGVELGKTLEREAEWRHLISSVRRIYAGSLTYSGNWWGDYDRVPFWDTLDVVGVDAYFPLAGGAEATDAELSEGARKIASRLAEDAQRYRRPILLTEVGFAARRGAWISPHEEGGEISEQHQQRAWSALLEALGRPSWLRGLYAWKVFSHERAERTTRPDFRFMKRPARAELERYFLATETQSSETDVTTGN